MRARTRPAVALPVTFSMRTLPGALREDGSFRAMSRKTRAFSFSCFSWGERKQHSLFRWKRRTPVLVHPRSNT